MKTLYLVRHAKSSWDDPSLDDIDRPLNGRGKKDAPDMGERLLKQNIKPDLLISSPARRAFSTAKRIAKKIGYPGELIRIKNELYPGSPDKMLNLVRSVPDSANMLMLFGHNPGLTEFANDLCKINIYNIPTTGIVSIEYDVSSWAQVEPGKGKLVFFDYPKKVSGSAV